MVSSSSVVSLNATVLTGNSSLLEDKHWSTGVLLGVSVGGYGRICALLHWQMNSVITHEGPTVTVVGRNPPAVRHVKDTVVDVAL